MNKRGKTVDSTFLSLDTATERGFIHRDYIAHCFRWSHAAKHIYAKHKEAIILDVGCGKEMPLPKLIYSGRKRPLHYVGLDVDDTPLPAMLEKCTFPCERLVGDIASVETYADLGLPAAPNFITCFEVLEHVELEHAMRCLAAIRNVCSDDATFMVSTPCFNLKDVADNHVNEMTYESFGAMLEDSGFIIENHYGTFANQSDYKESLFAMGGEALYEKLHEFHHSCVLSTIFAPMFPQLSRNVLWVCRPYTGQEYERQFPALEDCAKPWGSSEWKEGQ